MNGPLRGGAPVTVNDRRRRRYMYIHARDANRNGNYCSRAALVTTMAARYVWLYNARCLHVITTHNTSLQRLATYRPTRSGLVYASSLAQFLAVSRAFVALANLRYINALNNNNNNNS